MRKDEVLEIIKKEGDYKVFDHKGLKCEIKRIDGMGHLCGYLYVPYDNKFYSEDGIDEITHGGITYTNSTDGCDIWGFDCAHGGDFVPFIMSEQHLKFSSYKDMAYVEGVLRDMAEFVSGL